MPNVFDLDGDLRIDYSKLDDMEAEIHARTAGMEAPAMRAKLDTSEVEAGMRDVETISKQLGRVISKQASDNAEATQHWEAAVKRLTATERDALEMWLTLSEAAARPLTAGGVNVKALDNLKSFEQQFEDVLATGKEKLDEFLSRDATIGGDGDWGKALRKQFAGHGTRMLPMSMAGWRSRLMSEVGIGVGGLLGGQGAGGIASRMTSGATGFFVGGGVALGAGAMTKGLISGSVQEAQAKAQMAKSTKAVFGAAAAEYDDQAKALATSTGYATAALSGAQIALNRMVKEFAIEDEALRAASEEVRKLPKDLNISADTVKALTQRSTDLAAHVGSDDLEGVTQAVIAAIGGASGALLDFGVRMDDLHVLSLPVNAQFKAMGEAITPAQMAQARYNALMEQTATIAGVAADAQDDASRSMRKFHVSMQEAKASVGEVLIPIANTIADFVANIPKPLLKAGIWAGIGVGLAATVAGVVVAISAVKRALEDLGMTAVKTAAEIKVADAAQGGKGMWPTKLPGGLSRAGDLLSKVPQAIGYSGGGLSAGAGYAGIGALGTGIAGGMVLAAPAVVGAGLLMKYGENMEKNAKSELDAATERYRMNAARVARLTGATIPVEAAEQAARQGVDISRTTPGGQAITIVIQNQSDTGLMVSDAQSYAESPY